MRTYLLGTHCGGRRCALPPAPPHPLFFLTAPFVTYSLSWVRIAGGGAAPSPLHPPHPLFFFDSSLCYLLSLPFLQNMVSLGSSVSISTETCAYVLLAGYALRGEALRPPPCTPPPAFIFCSAPLATYSHSLFYKTLFLWVHLYQYPPRLVLTYFLLGTHCGGRRCALPPAPPHPLLFF